MNIKTNKKKINYKDRPKIKQEYFSWINYINIAEKYWYNAYALKKYLRWPATKNYIDSNNITWRRCNSCSSYKTLDKYLLNWYDKNWKKMLMSCCLHCYYRIQKNKRIIARNIWDKKFLNYWRRTWDKNKMRYNIKRKIMRLIWYTDRTWKIIKKGPKIF